MKDLHAKSAFASVVHLAQQDRKRENRRMKNLSVRFEKRNEDLFQTMEFDPENASKSIVDPGYEGVEHNDVPWDEKEYVELRWYEMPDLDEDDEITTLCKRIVAAGDYDMTNLRSINGYSTGSLHSTAFHQRKLDRVQGLVYQFALKLNNRYKHNMLKENSVAGRSCGTSADTARLLKKNTTSKQQQALSSSKQKSSSQSRKTRKSLLHSRSSSTHSKLSSKNNSSHSRSSLRSSSHSKSSCSGRSSHTGETSRSGRSHRKKVDKNEVIKNAKSIAKNFLPKNSIAKRKHLPRKAAKCVVVFPQGFDEKKRDGNRSSSSSSSSSDDDSSHSDSDSSSSSSGSSSSSSSDSASSVSSSDSSSSDSSSSSSDSDATGKHDCNDSSTQGMSSDSYRSDDRNVDLLKNDIFRPKLTSGGLTKAFRQRRQRAQRKRVAI